MRVLRVSLWDLEKRLERLGFRPLNWLESWVLYEELLGRLRPVFEAEVVEPHATRKIRWCCIYLKTWHVRRDKLVVYIGLLMSLKCDYIIDKVRLYVREVRL